MPTFESEVAKRQDRVAKLREDLAAEEAKRTSLLRDAENSVLLAQLEAEEEVLQEQLEAARAATKSAIKNVKAANSSPASNPAPADPQGAKE